MGTNEIRQMYTSTNLLNKGCEISYGRPPKRSGDLALTCFKTWVLLVDDVDAAAATNDFTCLVA